MAEARQQGATRVATFGGLQSNHARLTAAAVSVLWMEAHLLYFEPRPKALRGNLLLNDLLGARMHFFPLASKRPRPRSLEATIRLVRLLARLRVGSHYFIPVGGHTWLGALGYVRAAVEIDEQARGLGLGDAWLPHVDPERVEARTDEAEGPPGGRRVGASPLISLDRAADAA